MNRRGFLKALGIAPAVPYVPALELDPMPVTLGAGWYAREMSALKRELDAALEW